MYNYLFNEEIIKRNHDHQILNEGISIGEARGISIGEARGRNAGLHDAFELMIQQGLITPEAAQQQLSKLKAETAN